MAATLSRDAFFPCVSYVLIMLQNLSQEHNQLQFTLLQLWRVTSSVRQRARLNCGSSKCRSHWWCRGRRWVNETTKSWGTHPPSLFERKVAFHRNAFANLRWSLTRQTHYVAKPFTRAQSACNSLFCNYGVSRAPSPHIQWSSWQCHQER